MLIRHLALSALACILFAGCVASQAKPEVHFVPIDQGLKIVDTQQGTGAEAVDGRTVSVHYTGWLESNHKEFDSSRGRGKPFEFRLGAGQVIKGWDLGVKGMKVGGKRTLTIPAELGYGQAGAGNGLIPPGAGLVFDVELLDVR